MKIYAVADIHGCSNKFSMIQEGIAVHKPDVLVVAGDIANYFRPYSVISTLNNNPVPVLAVRGNADRPHVENIISRFSNITSLNLNSVTLHGVHFTGISGTVPIPFRTRLRLRERMVREKISRIISPMSVLVTHPPPLGVLDRVLKKVHAGCRSLKEIILKHQPRLVICGHIHEDYGLDYINETMVVNCSIGGHGQGALIELNACGRPKAVLL